jgi:glycosyltransferase involved in cell wall biosynthesis
MKPVAVIPAFNEAQRIGAVIQGAKKHVPDIIVVSDGSTDDTAEIARAAGARVIEHSVNSGAGAATMTGLLAARSLGFDTAITIDADGQHSSDDIPRLLQELQTQHADLVIADRFGRKNKIPLIRRFLNWAGNVVTFLVTGIYLPDTQCGFKVFGPKALFEVNLKMSGFEFCTEIIREAALHHWKVVSVPSKVVYSEYTLAKGQSSANALKVAAKILLRALLR